MHICLDLLTEQNYIEDDSLQARYEKTIGIYNLEREDRDMWQMTWDHKVQSLFQMEKQSGIQGIALTHPESVDDLATLNSVIRLMAQEKGAEQPLNKFARFKKNINLWYQEMDDYGLTLEEQKILEPIIKLSYGICESQEGFMQLVQMPECGGFDLTWADRLRKSIAKKNPAEYEKLTKEYFEEVEKKGLSKNLCSYVWNVLVATSRGYGFNKSHTLAYSLIGLQELNLGYRFPIEFWNCACLIADSGGAEIVDEDEDEIEEITEEIPVSSSYIEEFTNENDEVEEDSEDTTTTKKKKVASTNYGKIATAIGKMKMSGINVTLPDINDSTFTFSPDAEKHLIRYGLSGISRIGKDLIQTIINNKPYKSMEDFLTRVKVTKPQMVNLIKSGAFDKLCGDRIAAMNIYIRRVSEPKKRITLQNMAMLIKFKLLPENLEFEQKVYNFNKYLKKMKLDNYYGLDNIAYQFFESNYDIDKLRPTDNTESGFAILQTTWDNIYQNAMDRVRNYIKPNQQKLLSDLNECLFKEQWDKYAEGSISKWEMDSVSYYSHEHELDRMNDYINGISNFFSLAEEPAIDTIIPIKGTQIPLFKIYRIAGTVLDRDKSKKTVTLLTKEGVVTTKIFGQVFSYYDKQLSERGTDGKKHVVEKSWLSRGNKIVVTGIRRGDQFVAKKYKKTPYHLVEIIDDIDDYDMLVTRGKRVGDEEE